MGQADHPATDPSVLDTLSRLARANGAEPLTAEQVALTFAKENRPALPQDPERQALLLQYLTGLGVGLPSRERLLTLLRKWRYAAAWDELARRSEEANKCRPVFLQWQNAKCPDPERFPEQAKRFQELAGQANEAMEARVVWVMQLLMEAMEIRALVEVFHPRLLGLLGADIDPVKDSYTSVQRAEQMTRVMAEILAESPPATTPASPLPVTPASEPADPDEDRKRKEHQAMACLLNPDIGANATRIAREVGVKRTTLLGWKNFREAYDRVKGAQEAARQSRRRGRRAGERDFEVEDN